MCWYGADPGGIKSFGVAALEDDGSFKTWLCSSTDEALARIIQPAGVGIDCPRWWSSGKGGGRLADRWPRKTYSIASGTVQSVNSLKGAVLAHARDDVAKGPSKRTDYRIASEGIATRAPPEGLESLQ